ncbi:MAG: protein phosphatase 2C domain-containing protein, partial [Micrococcaceae bacterium]
MSTPDIHLEPAAASHVGLVRSNNQDSGYAGHNLVVLADGMGGHAGGDVASASTVLNLMSLDKDYGDEIHTILPDEIQNANSYLADIVREHPEMQGMGTTVTAGLVSGNTMQLAHIGDSRAYRLRGDDFEQISKDHSFVQRLVDEGKINAEEAKTHPHKNVILRVLGDVDASPELDLSTHKLQVGERWIMCSDGLSDIVTDNSIEQKLRQAPELQEAIDELIDLTLQGGSPDNVTIVGFEVKEGKVDEDEAEKNRYLVGSAAEVDRLPILADTPLADKAHRFLNEEGKEPKPDTEEVKVPISRKRSTGIVIAGIITTLAVAGAGFFGLKHWRAEHYFVAPNNGNVAIYQGFTQNLGPIKLSDIYETSDVQVKSLNQYTQQRLNDKIVAANLDDAKRIISDLRSSDLQDSTTG